jgi:hypothetical protein
MKQPMLEPCEKPTDLEVNLLYSDQVLQAGRLVVRKWYQELETGLVFLEMGGDWYVVCPLCDD